MELTAKGQRILITAGAGGIGRAMTETFVKAGAKVHICDVVQSALEETARALTGVTATLCDVSDLKQVDQLFSDVESYLGGLDVLVNNAGIAGPTGKVEELSIEDWRRCIDIDLNGMFYCTRLAVPMLKSSGGGSIINLSSAAGRLGFPFRTPYAAAKWGVVGFSKSLSMELGADNIRVNAVMPGPIETSMLPDDREGLGASRFARLPLGRAGRTDEVAELVVFLASDRSSYITGGEFAIDGGSSTGPALTPRPAAS